MFTGLNPILQVTGSNLALKPLAAGYQQLTVSTVAVTLTVPSGALCAIATLDNASNPLRWRDDGTAPTAAIGNPVADLSPRVIPLKSLAAIRFIRTGGTDAVLNVNYYGA